MSKLPCGFCDKLYHNAGDLLHHLELDHMGMDSDTLQEATAARETKKQLGDYLDITKKGVGVECPTCFEMFSGIENLITHGKKVHNKILDPKLAETLREMIQNNPNAPPICNKCHTRYLGLITTRINDTAQNICFNCYEGYFGANALNKITIGTPDEMILKMKTAM